MIYTVTLNPAVDRELTVPAVAFDTVLRATAWRVDCGGKGFNVSRMVQSLGGQSIALGFAGGRSGKQLEEGLNELGIETDFVWVAEETRTNVSVVSTENGRYLKVNEPGPTISQAEQALLLEKVQALAEMGDWWVVAGSLPPGVAPAFYGQLIEAIQASGATVLFDSSGEALREGCGKRPFLIKPNDVELQQLTNLPTETAEEIATAIEKVRQMGIQNLVVSRGKAGAMLFQPTQSWHISTPHITEKNPIGAGDSLLGGVVWGLEEGLALPEALRWGVACGAGTASLSGTAVGDRALVSSLLEQVELTSIA